MHQQDPRRGGPDRAGRLHVVALAQREHLCPHVAGHQRPADQRQRGADQRQPAQPARRVSHARAEDPGHQDRQQQSREGEQGVGDPREHEIGLAAEVPRRQPDRHPDKHVEQLHEDCHAERDPQPDHQPGQDVDPILVGAQQVGRAGPGIRIDVEDIRLGGALAVRLRADDRDRQQCQHSAHGHQRGPVGDEAPPGALPVGPALTLQRALLCQGQRGGQRGHGGGHAVFGLPVLAGYAVVGHGATPGSAGRGPGRGHRLVGS